MDQNPSYNEEDYPDRFLQNKTVFPPDAPLFHRLGYVYDYVRRARSAQVEGSGASLELELCSGERQFLTIRPYGPGVLRLQFGSAQAAFDEASPMLVPQPPDQAPAGSVQPLAETKGGFAFTFESYRLEIDRRPFCLRVISPGGEVIFESETETLVGMFTAPALGIRRKGGQAWAFLSWRSRNPDRYFGLGERFTRFEKTSSRATIWEADTCGSNTSDMAYKAVPVLYSTAGWGLMLHSSYRTYWEVGSFSYATASAMVEDDKLDLFLLLAPQLKSLVEMYAGLTGKPPLPPRWALGLWMSRAAFRDRPQMLETARRLRQESIPCDTLNIDPTWMEHGYYNDIGVEVCNFNWNGKDWGDADDLFAEFARLGYGICLWINPYFSEDSPAYAEALQKGYLVRTQQGGVARLEFDLAAGIIDLTNPQAKRWWQDKLAALMRHGALAFKVDFGDRIPENALFYNGRSGKEMHNLYVHLYAEAVYQVTAQAQKRGFIWRRPGYIGSQRFPGSWAGDTQVTWEGMRGALRGGLSAAFTSEAWWGHDIGGFVGAQPSPELYTRWVQFGLLSPLSRFHGTTPREPWHYGPTAVEVTRHYTQLRYRLVPYLLAAAQEATARGLPVLRPMVLEFPAEPLIDQVDDQYLMGGDLLVAPVFEPGVASRSVYFPAVEWYPYGGGQPVSPAIRRAPAPLERVPLYVRSGALLPRYTTAPQNLKTQLPRDWTLEIYPGESQRHLTIPEDDFTLQLDYTAAPAPNAASQGRLAISPAPLSFTVQMINRQLQTLTINGAPATWQAEATGDSFRVDGTKGAEIEFNTK